jgi:hypothetical protein
MTNSVSNCTMLPALPVLTSTLSTGSLARLMDQVGAGIDPNLSAKSASNHTHELHLCVVSVTLSRLIHSCTSWHHLLLLKLSSQHSCCSCPWLLFVLQAQFMSMMLQFIMRADAMGYMKNGDPLMYAPEYSWWVQVEPMYGSYVSYQESLLKPSCLWLWLVMC